MDKENTLKLEPSQCPSDEENGLSELQPAAPVAEIPKDELVRHERFHQAVKQLLTNGTSRQKTAPTGGKDEKIEYASLLSKQELNFLIK
jgi:hypothetical protein